MAQHQALLSEWRAMERYIRGLNEYQAHVEDKYSLLLDKFQQVITEQPDHCLCKKLVAAKDDEIADLVKRKEIEVAELVKNLDSSQKLILKLEKQAQEQDSRMTRAQKHKFNELEQRAALEAKEAALLRQANAELVQAFEELRSEYAKSATLAELHGSPKG